MQRWRRITQPTPPDPAATSPTKGREVSLLDRNPAQIGFMFAIGAMVAYGLISALARLQDVVLIVLLALAIALGLNRAVEFLRKRGLRRILAVIIVVLLAVVIVALATWAVVPEATNQVQNLYNFLPGYLRGLLDNPEIAQFNDQFKLIDSLISYLTTGELLKNIAGGVVGLGTALANMAFYLVVTVVLVVYFLASLPTFKEVIYRLAPASRRPRVRYLASEMMNRVGGYVSGLVLQVLIAITFALIYMQIVGLSRFSLALAVVMAVLWFIPVIGSTLAIVILTLVSFSVSPTVGLVTLILFLVYQQFDAYFISPRIMQHSVQVPGILVILGALSGGLVFGMLGAILAVPIMAALMLLYREVLIPHLDRK
jgi:predicted PurR-regulated permease PerM